MKRIIYSLAIFFCLFQTLNAQSPQTDQFNQQYASERITFPVNGSVFQMNQSGNHDFKFAGQTTANQSLVFRLSKKTNNGDSDWAIVPGYSETPISNLINGPDNSKIFYHSIGNLPKGWYKLSVYKKYNSILFTNILRLISKSYIQFGIGDVYFIGGQSNASGWYHSSQTNLDNAISTNGESDKFSPMSRTLNYILNERYETGQNPTIDKNRGIPFNSNVDFNSNNSPHFKSIISPSIPSNLDNLDSERSNIYPNGYNSWAYGPLSYRIATGSSGSNKFAGTPTLWFNCATGGTSINQGMGFTSWLDNPTNASSLIGKLDYTLLNFAGPFGAKAVLWHQGEYDHLGYLSNPSSFTGFVNSYKAGLSQIIDWTRQAADNSLSLSNNLNWFISDVSYTPSAAPSSNPANSNSSSLIGVGYVGGSNHSAWFSASLKTSGQSSSLLRPSPNNTLYHSNIFKGPSTDEMVGFVPGSSTNLYRASRYLIHFSSKDALNNLADKWYEKLYNTTTNNSITSLSIPPTELIPIQSVTKSGNNYTLTITNQGAGAKYYWLRNSDVPVTNIAEAPPVISGIVNNGNSAIFSSYNAGDFLVGYVFKNGRLYPVQPYLVPGDNSQAKSIRIQFNNLNIPANGGEVRTGIVGVNCDWEIVSNSNNFALNYSEVTGELLISNGANTSGSAKIENITIKEVGGTYAEVIVVTQSAASGITTSLASLNPTNSSSEWQGYGTARFNGTSIDGNVINIGGTQYTQGIGTHANSRIVYNINNAYSTFSCKFGMDQESNCCDGATFTIKADGQTIYGPVTKVWGQAATVVNGLSVAGKSTLELITDQISNNYADHTDWADVYLQSGGGGCGTPPIAPTSVSAGPSSISSGGSSTLSATCAYGTVTWSTGATGSSISVSPGVTTNYTVKCVSVGCPDSPVVGVTVNVSNSPCSAVTDNLVMGAWTVTNHPLVARYFNNQYWLTQRIGTNPEQFLVRGSNMLTRGDVTLNNGSYSSLTTCFGWQNSNFGGLAVPNSTQFPTPSGFTLAYEQDGTPFYTANGSCGLSAPTSVSASPASIISGQSSTLSATCATGTRLWSTGATSATIVVSPTTTTTYTVKCTQSGCPDSPTSSVTVQVGPCASLSHNLVMGTWNVTGHQLVAKYYHNQWWLVQRIASNPEKFLVRGSEMLTRGDVTLTNGSYSSLVGCFAWTYSAYGGLGTPNSTQFPTPSGWQYGTEPDGTPFYTSTGGARLASDQDFIKETVPSFISIYPNPNQGTFSIKVYLETASSLDIDLINSTGKIYQSIKAEGKEGQNEIPFTTQNISSGNYLIRVKTKDKVESKVVVIR